MKEIFLKSSINLTENLNGLEIIAFSISYDKEIFILSSSNSRKLFDENFEVIMESNIPYDYKILRENNLKEEIIVKNELFNFHDLGKISENEIILYSGRYPKNFLCDKTYKNAKVYDLHGNFKRSFYVGDCINDLQISQNHEIWISYADNGSFTDIWTGKSLVCLNKYGKLLYEFDENNELEMIAECYALNVENNDSIWVYPFPNFSIINLKNKKHYTVYENTPVEGFWKFAIHGKYILSSGGYNDDNFHFLELNNTGKVIEKFEVTFFDENNEKLGKKELHDARYEILVFRKDNDLYKYNITELIKYCT